MRSTKSTGYEGSCTRGVRDLARGTTIISRTEHKEYGVRKVRYSRGTKSSTEYGHYFQHGVRRVRSTKSTEYEGYGSPGVQTLAQGTAIFASTEHEEYGVRRVRNSV